jgi:AraC-like DNA-binding protein
MADRRTRRIEHDGPDGRWSLAFRVPEARLRPYVADIICYGEWGTCLSQRRELPSDTVTVIINLGPQLRVVHPAETATAYGEGDAFISGLSDTFALTETDGSQEGVQIRFTPIGAHLMTGLPMHRLANVVVPLENVFGPAVRELIARLHGCADWDRRFALVEAAIAARLCAAASMPEDVVWAWERLRSSDGRIAIADLADGLDISRKHLVERFRDAIGLRPKTIARVLRFRNAVRLLGGADAPAWADIALACGYYDQAHLIRDFRQFAGCTPGDFIRRRVAGQENIRAD